MDFQQYNAYFCNGISLLKEEIAHIEVYDVGVVIYEDKWGRRYGLCTNPEVELDWFYAGEPEDIPF